MDPRIPKLVVLFVTTAVIFFLIGQRYGEYMTTGTMPV